MRRFIIWTFVVGFAYYLILFGLLGLFVASSRSPLNDVVHVLILYVLPVALLIAVGVELGLFARDRGFMFRVAAVLFLSILACFISLQLAGGLFCLVGRECF
jgi:hypothetical protein